VSEEDTILALERAVKAVRKRLRRIAAEKSKRLGVAEVENFQLRCQLLDQKRHSSKLMDKVLSLDPDATAYIAAATPGILKNRQAEVRKCWMFGTKIV
jgi:phosphoenolpyruvate-protein kinase (PTS system EI component)